SYAGCPPCCATSAGKWRRAPTRPSSRGRWPRWGPSGSGGGRGPMTERLRIAQLAPLASPVTPDSGGSIEQLVSLLTEELVRRGHDVTLFATGDSRTSARLHALYPRGYEEDDDLWNWRLHESLHTAVVFER